MRYHIAAVSLVNDVAQCSESEENLRVRDARTCSRDMQKRGLKANLDKSKAMVLGGGEGSVYEMSEGRR